MTFDEAVQVLSKTALDLDRRLKALEALLDPPPAPKVSDHPPVEDFPPAKPQQWVLHRNDLEHAHPFPVHKCLYDLEHITVEESGRLEAFVREFRNLVGPNDYPNTFEMLVTKYGVTL